VSDNHKDYMGTDKEKEAAGAFAAEAIKEGMTVGVGTGTTAFFFIKALGFRCRNGLNIKALASSQASYELLKTEGIPLLSFDETPTLDITVDGADEITKDKHMIKGGGGALLREKIVAASSREMLVIVDEGKVKEKLGAAKLPIEIIPFYHEATLHKVNATATEALSGVIKVAYSAPMGAILFTISPWKIRSMIPSKRTSSS